MSFPTPPLRRLHNELAEARVIASQLRMMVRGFCQAADQSAAARHAQLAIELRLDDLELRLASLAIEVLNINLADKSKGEGPDNIAVELPPLHH